MAKVLITDGGGRGSALVDKYAQSNEVTEIFAVPGNDLMGVNTKKPVHIYPNLKTTSKEEILKICQENQVDLIDVAQDNAVEAGVADILRSEGFKVFGSSKSAGQLEWDKAYAREFMVKNNLPVPKFIVCHSEQEGVDFIYRQEDQPWVIKASGLAEGKGVLITQNNKEAILAIKQMKDFSEAGEVFLIEQFLVGEEFSSLAISDGKTFQLIASAQDHKRVFDGDQGPNTGGMGCSTPPLIINEKIKRQILRIFTKTFEGLNKENREYIGILYLGGIVVEEGGEQKVYIIEFNSRWGDPEVECILPGLKNDLFELTSSTINGSLEHVKIEMDTKARVVIAGASKGYPSDYSNVKGKQIFGIEEVLKLDGVHFYSAGIKKEKGKFNAWGGRLFYIVGEGKDVIEAREKAYSAMKLISVEGDNLHFRTDIGFRDVNRLNS